jgi:hypothetical protein
MHHYSHSNIDRFTRLCMPPHTTCGLTLHAASYYMRPHTSILIYTGDGCKFAETTSSCEFAETTSSYALLLTSIRAPH